MYRIPAEATDRNLLSAPSCFSLQRILAGVCRIKSKTGYCRAGRDFSWSGSAVNEI
jgi:hypothetical protein